MMHLSRKQIIEGIIFPLFLFYSCSESNKPNAYVARVNDSYLTEEELSEMIDSNYVSDKSRNSVIKNWVKQEVLYQQAVKQGITEQKDFKDIIDRTRRELAAATVLENFTGNSEPVYSGEDLKYYYDENKSSFRLPFNSYFINRISFTNENTAVQFRTDVISGNWNDAAKRFAQDTSLVEVSNDALLPEHDIYPQKLLRVLEGLYPLEISIVISDDRGYYTVVQLIDKYIAQSIPPFKAVKKEVTKRYISALTELALEDYIIDLYNQNEIEIKK